MEVRLSDFADIVGSTPTAIRSAIAKPDDLPFDDREFRMTKDAGRVIRRRYGVADAFAWFLADEIPTGLGIRSRRMSTFVRRSWGIPAYVDERLELGRDLGNRFLLIWSHPAKETHEPCASYRFGSEVAGVERAVELKGRRSAVLTVDLDLMFEQFLTTVRQRGWEVSRNGFSRRDTEGE